MAVRLLRNKGRDRSVRVCTAFALAVAVTGAPAFADGLAVLDPAKASRFRVEGMLKPLAVSANGRFAVDAVARYAPAAASTHGRFTLTATRTPAAGCGAAEDNIFTDGFEAH